MAMEHMTMQMSHVNHSSIFWRLMLMSSPFGSSQARRRPVFQVGNFLLMRRYRISDMCTVVNRTLLELVSAVSTAR